MRALVYGAGSIYNEFYFPIFKHLKVKIDIIDPRISNQLVSNDLNYDFVLISSPPEIHIKNFLDVLDKGIKFRFLIVEKPALTSILDYCLLKTRMNEIAFQSIFTVTPRRLSLFGKFWSIHGHSVKTLNLVYGVQSKWVLNSYSHSVFNSCGFDLGPHFLDLINNCNPFLKNMNLNLLDKKIGFNDFYVKYSIGETLINVYLSRKDYLSNVSFCETFEGKKIILSLDNNDGFYSDMNNCKLDITESNSLIEFKKIVNGDSSLLFSHISDFNSILTLLDLVYA
jgi:hypothetical protein